MGDTRIEWATKTLNVTVGCSIASPGCDHCYAAGLAHRNLRPEHRGLTVKPDGEPVRFNGVVRCLPERLDEPAEWRTPQRIFVDSMSDLFHPQVPTEFILRTFSMMSRCPQHTFMLLTKRPQRMRRIVDQMCWADWQEGRGGDAYIPGGDEDDDDQPIIPGEEPLDNVMLGTSIESNDYVWRVDHLRNTPAAVRFLSLEPLLGPIPSLNLDGIDLVIVGGESGPRARPMHPEWVEEIFERCKAARVCFFFKQWGEWGLYPPGWPEPGSGSDRSRAHAVAYDGRHWPEDELAVRYVDEDDPGGPDPLNRRFEYVHDTGRRLAREHPNGGLRLHVMHRVGKKAAGRELHGRSWDEYPAPQQPRSVPGR